MIERERKFLITVLVVIIVGIAWAMPRITFSCLTSPDECGFYEG